MEPKLFIAGKAFIKHNGKILVLRESSKYQDGTQTGKYDVAGGRLKPGENFLEALKREVKEELNLKIKNLKFKWVAKAVSISGTIKWFHAHTKVDVEIFAIQAGFKLLKVTRKN